MKAVLAMVVWALLAGCLEARPGGWSHPAMADIYRRAVMVPTNVKETVKRNMHLPHTIVKSLNQRGLAARQAGSVSTVCNEFADLILEARDLILEMWPGYLQPRFEEVGGSAEVYANQYITILPYLNKELVAQQICIITEIRTEEQLAQLLGIPVYILQASLAEARPIIQRHIPKQLILAVIDGVLKAERRLYNILHEKEVQVSSQDLIPTLKNYFTVDEMKEFFQEMYTDLKPALQYSFGDLLNAIGADDSIPDQYVTLAATFILNTSSLSELAGAVEVPVKYIKDVDEFLKTMASAPPQVLQLEEIIAEIFKKIVNDTKIYEILVNRA